MTGRSKELRRFLKDLDLVYGQTSRGRKNAVAESAFDRELLEKSALYRRSRQLYLALGGVFHARVCSTTRALKSQDLLKDEIDFSPLRSELRWFRDHHSSLAEPEVAMQALISYNEVSLFHEQNHRILWRFLPRAPREKADFLRYLNFAESLVVTLDVALGDELGPGLSSALERLRAIYRPAGRDRWFAAGNGEYRRYLLGVFATTYFLLELRRPPDILKGLRYILPGSPGMMKDAFRRGRELSPIFTLSTNRQWQELRWRKAMTGLARLQTENVEAELLLPEEPLDLDHEFEVVERALEFFGSTATVFADENHAR